MGLSSKQVSGDNSDWTQNLLLQSGSFDPPKPLEVEARQQQPQTPPLQCPRCSSTNTKFCYYNNYNRSQPRHFCRSCRRHWTKGGTLRNVPVGGGRKNKRPKKSTTTNSHQKDKTTTSINTTMTIQQQPLLPALVDQRNISEILQHNLQGQLLPPPRPYYIESSNGIGGGSFPPMPQFPPFLDMSSYDIDLSSSSSDQSHPYNHIANTIMNDATFENNTESMLSVYSQLPLPAATTTTATTTTTTTMSLEMGTGDYLESVGYWNWDDLGL